MTSEAPLPLVVPRIFPAKVISAPASPVSPGSVSTVNPMFPRVKSPVPKSTVSLLVFIVTSLALLIT